MEYPAYVQAKHYNTVTGNPATSLFLRHKIGNLASKESWIYYYEPADNNYPLVPKLPILSEKSSQNLADYWHFALVTESHTFKLKDEFSRDFPGMIYTISNVEINIDTMNFVIFFTTESGNSSNHVFSTII